MLTCAHLALAAKVNLVLERTNQGADLHPLDVRLIQQIQQQGSLTEVGYRRFERLFSLICRRPAVNQPDIQVHPTNRRCLFGLSQLEIDQENRVLFCGDHVDNFRPVLSTVSQYEHFVRLVLYPACRLAQHYGVKKLSTFRIQFFINEIQGCYRLRSISSQDYERQRQLFSVAFESETGFLMVFRQ